LRRRCECDCVETKGRVVSVSLHICERFGRLLLRDKGAILQVGIHIYPVSLLFLTLLPSVWFYHVRRLLCVCLVILCALCGVMSLV
jgi:hypothetical protein